MFTGSRRAAVYIFFFSCNAQPSSPYAPEAGNYSGYIYGVQLSTTTNLQPSAMGDMTITSKGNNAGTYSFAKGNMKGEWKYDEKSNELQCTGALKDALTYYHAGKGFYTMEVTMPAEPNHFRN